MLHCNTDTRVYCVGHPSSRHLDRAGLALTSSISFEVNKKAKLFSALNAAILTFKTLTLSVMMMEFVRVTAP